jgi:ribonuclease P protein component
MNSPGGERFPKSHRLRKRLEYLAIQQQGLRVQSYGFTGLLRIRESGATRLGITITKKIGNAVVRNRTKRLVREAFRRGWFHLPDRTDVIIVAKKTAVTLNSKAVFKDLSILGDRVTKRVEQRR